MLRIFTKKNKVHNQGILFITAQMNNCAGIERVVANLANYFIHDNLCSIAVINSSNNSFYSLNKNIKIIPLCILNKNKSSLHYFFRKIIMFFTIKKLIQTINPKFIISTEPEINVIMAVNQLLNSQIICIGAEHQSADIMPMGKINFLIRKFSYNYLATIVVLTNHSKTWLQQIGIKKIHVIANPIIYPITNGKPIVNVANVIKTNKNTLIAVGRLHPQKGFDLLLPIFKKLVKKHDNWQLVILGEGEQRLKLEQQINKLELQTKVYMPGTVGNLTDWYKVSDLFVLSSRYEGLPCALIEAMAYGLPAVSFACKSGPSDIITHGINGLLVEDGNTAELYKSLDTLISNKKLRQQFALKAIAVKEKFNIHSIGKQWEQLFNHFSNN